MNKHSIVIFLALSQWVVISAHVRADENPPRRLGSSAFRSLFPVKLMVCQPNGQSTTSIDYSGCLHHWTVPEGKPARGQFADEPNVTSVTFSRDGQLFAITAVPVGRVSGVPKVWNDQTQRHWQYWDERWFTANVIALAPDGKTMVTGGYRDGKAPLVLWDLTKREVIREFQASHENLILSVAYSPDGKLVASGDGDPAFDDTPRPIPEHPIRIWDPATGKLLANLKHHKSSVRCVAFSPDGKHLASCSSDKTVVIWDVSQEKILHQWTADAGVRALAYSAKGDLLAAGNHRGVDLFDPIAGKRLRHIPNVGRYVTSLAFTPDGKTLLTASWEQAVRLWEVATGNELTPPGHVSHLISLSFAADGKTLVSFGADSTVRTWDLAAGKEIRRTNVLSTGTTDFTFDSGNPHVLLRDGTTFAREGQKRASRIELWNIGTGKNISNLASPPDDRGAMLTLGASPDGKLIAAGTAAGICIWSLETGKPLKWIGLSREEKEHQQLKRYHALAFLPDNRTVVAGTRAGALEFWDVDTAKMLSRIEQAHPQVIRTLALSADGRYLVSLGQRSPGKEIKERYAAHVWELATGERVGSFQGHEGMVLSAAFAPDGFTLATGGEKDDAVRLWSLLTGEELVAFKSHQGAVPCVAFSPDGATLASGGLDTTILLWDVRKHLPPVPPPATDERLEGYWKQLSGSPADGMAGVRGLSAAGDRAVAFLSKRLTPWAALDERETQKLLGQLDARDPATRQKAEHDLACQGQVIEKQLRKALGENPVLDKQRAIERLLANTGYFVRDSEVARDLRALQALERIDTAEARKLIESLASGQNDLRLTHNARLSLVRQAKKAPPK